MAGFGIKVTLIEPSGYSTDWAGSSARHAAELPAYDPVREQAAQARAGRFTPGDPCATRAAVLKLVDTPNPPLRLFLGEAPLGIGHQRLRRDRREHRAESGGRSAGVQRDDHPAAPSRLTSAAA